MKSYDWVLLDADNTLLDFNLSATSIIKKIIEDLGFEPSEENLELYKTINKQYWQQLEKGIIDIPTLKWKRFHTLIERLGAKADPHEVAQFFMDTLAESTDLVPNCDLFLNSLVRKSRLVLATNGIAYIQRRRMERNKLESFFEFYIISEEVGAAKPKTGFFQSAFEKMAHPNRSKVLIIGDSLHADIAGGINYGIDTCWFNPTQMPNESTWEPTYEINELMEIEMFLK